MSSFPLESSLPPRQDDARVAMANTSPTLPGDLPLQANFCSLSIFLSLCYIVSHSESRLQSITFSAESFLWKQLAICLLFCSLLFISRHEPWWQGCQENGAHRRPDQRKQGQGWNESIESKDSSICLSQLLCFQMKIGSFVIYLPRVYIYIALPY